MSDRKARHLASRWQEFVLVCRKCSKRLGGGFGPSGDQRLAKALRQELTDAGRTTKGRKAELGIVEVGCLDICPKRGVVAIRSAEPDEWLIIPAGMPMAEAAELLLPATDQGLTAAKERGRPAISSSSLRRTASAKLVV